MAAPADKIFAQRGTITGSIGVFFGKPNLRGLMEKLDINVSSLSSRDRQGEKSDKALLPCLNRNAFSVPDSLT